MSRKATPFVGLFLLNASDSSLLPRILANVDFPDDLGPQIMMIRFFGSAESDSFDSNKFHSGGDIKGCV